MATGSSSTTSRSLQDTPTWALATVCFIFISLSILIEHLIHLISNWLKKHRKTALFEAVEKLKSVLILLGFMSLLLAVTQRPISKICIPTKVAYTMLPCRKSGPTKTTKALAVLLMEDLSEKPGRRLAGSGASSSDHCESQGKTSFISQEGINQLNNLIFVVAIMQIVYSVLTMALGRAKMRRWEKWEKETQTLEYQVANDPYRFRYTRQTTFARRHMNTCTATSSMLLWIKCFFQQFFRSVAKVDYLTLRHGFIAVHLSTNNSFDFQKYIQRSLEDDFKVVVGISPVMWFLVVIFMLVDVHGWHVYLWVSFAPLLIVLVLGTKLEVIVARMAHALDEKNNVIIGSPLVQPNDNLFWFGHPKFVLTFLHLTLFMNAFELSFFVWVTWQFGIKSCYHEHTDIIVIRVVLAVTVQLICSYVTLPLYALVTQMGSNFKSAVLEEHTAKAIRQWHEEAKQKRKKNHTSQSTHNDSSSTTIDHTSATNINSISPDHPVSGHHTRSPSFADQISPFSTDNEIVEEHYSQEIGQNTELDQSVALPSSTVQDIKMLGSEEKPING
ncbi:MLO-like protein 3 [Morus notabilis]|uniref:MLO-like protein 3 n=1 Tax=Morus notabilis TaxID=981085 RepID=UPI000CED73E7|nr:MLO-like protein 3 [Morus notabilis]